MLTMPGAKNWAGGPPPAAPTMPNMDAFGSSPTASNAAAIPRLVFDIEQKLNDLAKAVPGQSEEIDKLKSHLRDVMAEMMASSEGPDTGGSGEIDTPMSPAY